MNRGRFIASAGSVAGAPLVPAVAWGAAPRRGGVLVVALAAEPTSLVGAFNTADPSTIVASKIEEGLVTYDYGFNLKPRLATSWSFAPDGKSARFTLRKGVKWHDGTDFTSADVQFTFVELLKKYHPRGRVVYADLLDVETPDALTAIFRFAKPSPMVIGDLAGYESPVLPKHVYAGSNPLTNPANNAPIGTGPFVFKSWDRGSAITFDRNPNYWEPGRPYLDRVVLRVISDTAALVAALQAGEVQVSGPNPVPSSQLAQFASNRAFVIETHGEELLTHLQSLQLNLRNPMLAKLEVRQAIAHAINRDLIARLVWNGYATAARSPVSRQAGNAQARSLPEYRYDPAAANALLDKAGYPRVNGGSRFSVRLDWVPLGESNLLAAQLIKQQLAAVGINAEIRSADFATYIKQVYADYDFDLNLMLYTPTHDPSIGLDRFYSSKSAIKGTPFVNAGGYASPAMDGILAAADNEADPGKRKALLDAFQRKAMEDLPMLPILDLSYVTVRSARVQGLMDSPEGIRGNFADVWLSP